jgi:TfoX/Sxy family transcriptional regulator of competence genes
MAYDEALAARIRGYLGDGPGISERKMFGGICFMVNGNMCAGVTNDRLMARVGAPSYEAALKRPGAYEMEFTGRPMTGMVFVNAADVAADDTLASWLAPCLEFASSLKPKVK